METIQDTIIELNNMRTKLVQILSNHESKELNNVMSNDDYIIFLTVGNSVQHCINAIDNLYHNEL